ncbi:iron reductase [Mycena epipterygia]|nr:iron reductase [Mycena epipterygia]
MDLVLSNISVDIQTAAKAVSPDRTLSHARTYAYPLQVWYFLGSFIALVSACHFITTLISWVHSKNPEIRTAGGRGRSSLRRIPVAILNLVRNAVFRITISLGGSVKLNLTELLLGCAYIGTLFTWALINTTNLEDVYLSPQYYANRAGLIAATQIPLLIALGMKNNILTFLTGISFDKLNFLHRVAARVLCVMLWLHAAGHVRRNMENLQESWFQCGIMAISALTLLSVLSVQSLRSRAYELFLLAHFIFVLIFLCGGYYHANNGGLGYYIWPSLLLWGFDRFLRFIRIFLVNGGYSTLFNTKASSPLRAQVEVICPQFLRVTLRRPDHFKWAPGQLAYLSIPSVSAKPWEAHPFTIASIDGDIPRPTDSQLSSRDESFDKENSVESVAVTAETLSAPGYSKKLVFLLRVHTGFTKRLLAAASTSTNETFGAYVDGPYCLPPSVRGFGTVLLLCGGSGISFTLPLLLDVIRAANMGTNPTCGKVMLVWAIRHPEQIKSISGDLTRALDAVSDTLRVEIRIHVTASIEDTEPDVEKSESSVSTSDAKLLAPAVRIIPGRPDVTAIVKSEVAAASGSISVNVCGTAGLAEHVRSALREASSAADVLKGSPSVSLHVETFGM